MAYILRPSAPGLTTSKAAAQRLQGWAAYVGQFQYRIEHIPGTQNSWGDMLSRTVTQANSAPSAHVPSIRCMPVTASTATPMSDKGAVRAAQSAAAGPHVKVQTGYGVATTDGEGLFRVTHRGRRVLWIPEHAEELKKRLLVSAHMQEAGHRGVAATLERLRAYCVWKTMEE